MFLATTDPLMQEKESLIKTTEVRVMYPETNVMLSEVRVMFVVPQPLPTQCFLRVTTSSLIDTLLHTH